MTHVAVVGGGITGLGAARLLARRGYQVTIVEATRRWGGKLAPVVIDDVRLDGGAESVLARRPEAVDLIKDLGLGAGIVHPTGAKPRLLIDGSSCPLPPSLLGVPTDLEGLRGILSGQGFLVAAGEPVRPAAALDHDVAIGDYVDRRFGPEVTDRLLDPHARRRLRGRSPSVVLRSGGARTLPADAYRRVAAAARAGRGAQQRWSGLRRAAGRRQSDRRRPRG